MGALMDDECKLAIMPSVCEALLRVPLDRAAGYSPIAGPAPFLEAIISDLFGDSPLAAQSVAAATPGGTGAIYHSVVNFLEPGQNALTTDYFWGPYSVITEHAGRGIDTFNMFGEDGRFDLDAFATGIDRHIAEQGRALILLNFPCHNPTGYSLDEAEWAAVAEVVRFAGERAPVATVYDCAYLRFADPASDHWLHAIETMLETGTVLVAWTASKTFAQYGARIGALVAMHQDADERQRLSNAMTYSCRATWSNCSHHGQLAITELLTDPDLKARAKAEREDMIVMLRSRASVFDTNAREAALNVPRYEGGFFVAVFTPDGEKTAEVMRDEGVYVVPMEGAVRVALCCTPEAQIPRIVEALRIGVDAAGG
jgi:aromatic-amino-acid transaminase